LGDLVVDLEAGSEELIETHISWVFLRARDVFKVKKPVDFGFLDFSDLASRERACNAEVELNTRLAPGVYRGVVTVTRNERGEHEIAGHGQVVDYAVHMARLPVEARADLALARGELGVREIDAIARCLARFHERAARDPRIAEFGRIELIRGNVEENFAQARASLQKLAGEAAEREVEERQLAFLARRAELFERRVEAGQIRDGHGDLRLEHVYLVGESRSPRPGSPGVGDVPSAEALTGPDQDRRTDALVGARDPIIIDCIEFNERFRFADVCADVAFLSMDLGWHGRHDLKERLLATYVHETGDHDLYALIDFYESYRAYVRAKVSAFSLASNELSFSARSRLETDARRYLLLALAAERPALARPRLLAVGGMIASGKSSLAQALGARLGAVVIGSDELRKRLHGVERSTPLHHAAWQDAYGPSATARVYSELLRRARVVLESGRSVVIDATFRSRADRAECRRLAASMNASFHFVECRVPEAVARARLAERARHPSVSDGRLEIYDAVAARYEPVTELGPSQYTALDSSGPLERSLAQLGDLTQPDVAQREESAAAAPEKQSPPRRSS
jgi:aminoglycoside phosphotransferase family enzyme/predicted kinase